MTIPESAKILAVKARELKAAICTYLAEDKAIYFLFCRRRKELPSMSLDVFADACAQTVVCACLSMHWMYPSNIQASEKNVELFIGQLPEIVKKEVVALLAGCREVKAIFDQTVLALQDVDVQQFFAGSDPVIHFYEPFLSAYDSSTRRIRGVYYTPPEVVHHMVMVVHEQLQTTFGLPLGLADESTWQELFDGGFVAHIPAGYAHKPFVQILDPALGTGTYVKKVIEVIRDTMQDHWQKHSPEQDPQRLWQQYVNKTDGLLERLHGFEVLMAPLVIAHLRLGFLFAQHQTLPLKINTAHLRLHLTNTLQKNVPSSRVAKVKNQMPITVVIGNPPYKREAKSHQQDNWIRQELLTPYQQGSSIKGYGVHLKNIYNAYVYFWRFSEWKVHTHSKYGVVSLITASSFLNGPGFYGLREHFKNIGSHLYVIDLEGNQRGFRITENVFKIQTAVAIATLVIQPDKTFVGKYHRVEGTAQQKKDFCLAHPSLRQIPFLDISNSDTFVAQKSSVYHSFPKLTDLFPWQHSGIQFKRTWPIAPTKELLQQRIQRIVRTTDIAKKKQLFQEGDRTIEKSELNIFTNVREIPFQHEEDHVLCRNIQRYSYRAFDRSWCLADNRVCSRPRKKLWRVHSAKQIYFAGILKKVNVCGPAILACTAIPDLDFLRSGGKDIIPLYKDKAATKVNICPSVYENLCTAYQMEIPQESLYHYLYSLLTTSHYIEHYNQELQMPGPKVPITKNLELFMAATKLGKQLICIHTFGERLSTARFRLEGQARRLEHLPSATHAYPEKFIYAPETKIIWACRGRQRQAFVEKVDSRVWNFSISGFKPIQSWLKYRTKTPHKISFLLDSRPHSWTFAMTEEFIKVIHAIEMTIDKQTKLKRQFKKILATRLFTHAELTAL